MRRLSLLQRITHLLCITGFLFVCSTGAAENTTTLNTAGTAGATPASDTLVVTARVVEIPGRFAPNNAYDYVYIMKYRIIRVEQGTCSDKEILVGQYNPLIPRAMIKDKMDALVDGNVEKFAVGEKQHLTLVAPLEKYWDGPVETEYYDTTLKPFFAVKADIIK